LFTEVDLRIGESEVCERRLLSKKSSTSKNYLYALKILVVFGVENGMKYVEQGVFFNLKTRKEWTWQEFLSTQKRSGFAHCKNHHL